MVTAPADKRFRRARITPARRRKWTTRSWWRPVAGVTVVTGLLVFGGFRAVELALTAEALTISTISIVGNERMSRGEVLALLEGLSGQNMVTVDLEEWRQKLLLSPWVADAAVRRILPGALLVAISERQPMAIGRDGDRLYLVDRTGRVIDDYGPNYAEFDLPLIDGFGRVSGAGGTQVDPARAALAADVLNALQARPEIARRVSQLDVSDPSDAVLLLEGDTAYVRIGDEFFVERLQSYLELAPTLREQVPDIDYVDLRFDDRVYVRPHGASRSARPTASREKGE